MLFIQSSEDYELIDSGSWRKLERYGTYLLDRPEPQAIWTRALWQEAWSRAHAKFDKSEGGIGKWSNLKGVSDHWMVNIWDITMKCRLAPYRHTGLFPEQSAHWKWMSDMIRSSKREISVLNTFAYTGGASLACQKAGGRVTHVDASRPTIGWAQDNQKASALDPKGTRWILDDVLKFVRAEARRGKKYDAVIADPPVFGHGAEGEVWEFHRSFPELILEMKKILSDTPLFVLVNLYAVSIFPSTLANILQDMVGKSGVIDVGELCIEESSAKRMLPTGIYGRWTESR